MQSSVILKLLRRVRRSPRRAWLLALLPLVLLLTSPALRPSPPARYPAQVPTAALLLNRTLQAAAIPARSQGVAQATGATVGATDTPAPLATAATAMVVPLPTPLPLPPDVAPEQLPPIGPPANAETVPESLPAPAPPPDSPPAAAGTNPASYIPILMYHYIRTVDAVSDPLGYNLSVTPEQFAAQIDWLANQGYTPVRMDIATRCLQGEPICPERPVVLTFDDGYSDAYSAALPLLQQHGFVATFYIVSGFVGQPGYMGWDELRALRDAGMEIGAHSVHHPDLTALGWEGAYAEIASSGQQLAETLQIPVVSFCYPAGRFTGETAAIVREAGYTSATTTMPAAYQGDLYALPRLRMSGNLTLEGFAWLVQAYGP